MKLADAARYIRALLKGEECFPPIASPTRLALERRGWISYKREFTGTKCTDVPHVTLCGQSFIVGWDRKE